MNTTIELMHLRDQAAREITAATDHQEYCRAHGVLNIVLAAVKKFTIPTEENLNGLKYDIQQYKDGTSRRTQLLTVNYKATAKAHSPHTRKFTTKNKMPFNKFQ